MCMYLHKVLKEEEWGGSGVGLSIVCVSCVILLPCAQLMNTTITYEYAKDLYTQHCMYLLWFILFVYMYTFAHIL